MSPGNSARGSMFIVFFYILNEQCVRIISVTLEYLHTLYFLLLNPHLVVGNCYQCHFLRTDVR